ncbi:MAG: toprim domain-containing protein [Patescibacteria group bacterium]|jgi:5S rRNA maturation endonuclease (ribonuclease M5)
MYLNTIKIREYLDQKGIKYSEANGELITDCVFCGKARHLYFSSETSQYDCKVCGEQGNIYTLAKHLGDKNSDVVISKRNNYKQEVNFSLSLVEKCHKALPDNIRDYLNKRGVNDEIINTYKLGFGTFYRKKWITIPIKNKDGEYIFFKLRQSPEEGNDKITYPKGIEAQIYDWEEAKQTEEKIMICEGELDSLLLLSKGVKAITSTHGAMTFKREWIEEISKNFKDIYICFDNDEAGKKGAKRIAKILEDYDNNIFITSLPEEVGVGGDITDYFIKLNGGVDDLFSKHSKEYPKKIDSSNFKEIGSEDLIKTLDLTIKRDNENKLITFLCQLSAYTESSQLNVSFNAPSSTGKSYIPMEIAKLFPKEDIVEIGYCSPTAFFHDSGEIDKNKGELLVDLSRKIIIFLDQPHTLLLQHLRPLLSHDKKEINIKITDKSQKSGLRTKNVILRGFPAVIFCTAGLKIDEQESTRFILLSPEANQDKIREAILQKINKESDDNNYNNFLDNNEERASLKKRIIAIKGERIRDIKIASPEKIKDLFISKNKILKPRHQRDIGKIISLTKAFALLNLWFRDRNGSTILANDNDIEEAFNVWDKISKSQELNLPPFIFNIYKEIIIPSWKDNKKKGISRQDIFKKYSEINGRGIADWILRQQVIPSLEDSGLIIQEKDKDDKRKILIYPTNNIVS